MATQHNVFFVVFSTSSCDFATFLFQCYKHLFCGNRLQLAICKTAGNYCTMLKQQAQRNQQHRREVQNGIDGVHNSVVKTEHIQSQTKIAHEVQETAQPEQKHGQACQALTKQR